MFSNRALCIIVVGVIHITTQFMFSGSDNIEQKQPVNPPLHEAVKSGDLQKVKEILKENPDSVKVKNTEGLMPIHWAAHAGNCVIARELMLKGSAFNEPDNHGFTPLFLAAHAKHKQMVAFLIRSKVPTEVPPVNCIHVQLFINQVIQETSQKK